MTFEDFLYAVVEIASKHPGLRIGQAIMNKLYEHHPVKYADICNTADDCFYIEALVPKILMKLKEEWND